MNSFDQVGGKNTLRSVWAKLKGSNRVRGSKRSASDEEESSPDDRKKVKRCLEISSTLNEFDNINLGTSSSSGVWSLNEVFRSGDDFSDLSSSKIEVDDGREDSLARSAGSG